jgi:hypothetical protein
MANKNGLNQAFKGHEQYFPNHSWSFLIKRWKDAILFAFMYCKYRSLLSSLNQHYPILFNLIHLTIVGVSIVIRMTILDDSTSWSVFHNSQVIIYDRNMFMKQATCFLYCKSFMILIHYRNVQFMIVLTVASAIKLRS